VLSAKQGKTLHSIKNIKIGHLLDNTHHTLYLAFPNLEQKADMTWLYNAVLLPTALRLGRQVDTSRFPVTYNHLKDKARKRDGTYGSPRYLLNPTIISNWGDVVLGELARREGYDDAFFIHQIQGVKGATAHYGLDEDERSERLTRLLHGFDVDRMLSDDTAEFYVDIGLEFQYPGYVCLWRRAKLRYILKWVFVDLLDDGQLETLYGRMEGSIDITALLRRYAGFRLEVPDRLAKASGIAYMQVYCTEKNAHYTYSKSQFDPISPHEFGPGKKTGVQSMAAVLKAFNQVRGNPPQTSCRMEMRVRLTRYTQDSFTSMDDNLVKTAITGLRCPLWW
jgi:hypothetical protein